MRKKKSSTTNPLPRALAAAAWSLHRSWVELRAIWVRGWFGRSRFVVFVRGLGLLFFICFLWSSLLRSFFSKFFVLWVLCCLVLLCHFNMELDCFIVEFHWKNHETRGFVTWVQRAKSSLLDSRCKFPK